LSKATALLETLPELRTRAEDCGREDLLPMFDAIEADLTRGDMPGAMRKLLPTVREIAITLTFPFDLLFLISFRLCLAQEEIATFFGYGNAKSTTYSVKETANRNRWH
jgi:hypothetical protein